MIFVDTGAWVAIADKNDQYAGEASKLYKGLIFKREQLISSEFVLIGRKLPLASKFNPGFDKFIKLKILLSK